MKLYSTCRISLALTAISLVGLATSLPAAAAKMYSITDLGTLGGNYSQATGINDLGQVVGGSNSSTGKAGHAFRTAPNSPINPATDDLGSLDKTFDGSVGNSISNLGQVAGYSKVSVPGQNATFLTAPNSPINPATDDLGSFGGRGGSFGASVNDLGQVAGEAAIGSGFPNAFRTAPNSPIDPTTDNIGSLALDGSGESFATGINDSGQVVGGSAISRLQQEQVHAFRTAPNSPINPATDDLGTLGGEPKDGQASVANAINNKGQVVGNSQTVSGETHAFRTSPNSPINPATDDLGTLGGGYSKAYAINNKGRVVGSADTDSGQHHAFVYYKHHMLDLNNLIPADSNFVLTSANGINKKGQIVGDGYINGETHAFLLTPER